METPGHSNGSISYFIEGENVLITGDAIILPGELPIYTDYRSYIKSIEKIKTLLPFQCLLSSWDTPKLHNDIETVLQQSLDYINRIGVIVEKVSNNIGINEPMQFCKAILKQLDIPEFVANPLLVKSFMSHL